MSRSAQLPALVLTPLLALAGTGTGHATEPLGLLELFNYYEYSPALASSGQPTREQLPLLAAAGVEAVINLVPVDSPDAYAEEGELVRALGLAYRHIPIDWENPTVADLDAFFAAMESFAGKRLLVHCYANARASAFVYLWRVLQAGHDDAAARATLETIWDWNAGYELRNVATWATFIDTARGAAAPGAARP
ncbi:MAG: protein tyrosine phosphatase family protein [Gammaproteobacteria bacterium]